MPVRPVVITGSSDSEQFLAAFHDSNPGITSRSFADLPVLTAGRRFASSYECLANEVPEIEGARALLDLACGDGLLLSLFAARGQSDLSLIGVDLSRGELAAARRRLGRAATLQQGRAHYLPIATASLDHVVCHMALMLMDDVENVLAEVHRVLKKGAVFAAVVGARPPLSPVLDSYIALLSQYPRQEEFKKLRLGDRRLRTQDDIAKLLSHDFRGILVQELLVQRRCFPRELCAWFAETYDFHMLGVDSQRDLSSRFIAALDAQCEGDGRVEYNDLLYLITAAAA